MPTSRRRTLCKLRISIRDSYNFVLKTVCFFKRSGWIPYYTTAGCRHPALPLVQPTEVVLIIVYLLLISYLWLLASYIICHSTACGNRDRDERKNPQRVKRSPGFGCGVCRPPSIAVSRILRRRSDQDAGSTNHPRGHRPCRCRVSNTLVSKRLCGYFLLSKI